MLTLSTLSTSSDFTVTDAIIDRLSDSDLFERLARFEEDLLVKRDEQDAELLQAGIQKGIDEGALKAPSKKPVYQDIDVTTMEADERARYMVTKLPPMTEGCVAALGRLENLWLLLTILTAAKLKFGTRNPKPETLNPKP